MIASNACVFPYTNLSPTGLAGALVFFKEIILYRLPMDQLDDHLALAADKGLLRVVETSFFQDTKEIDNILAQFSSWSEMMQDPGNLSMLHGLSSKNDVERSGARLMSSIRHPESDAVTQRDYNREAQIFLHFTRRLDQQQDQIKEHLSKALDKEDRLSDLMGVETPAPELAPGDSSLFWASSEDPGLEFLPQRLTAWGRFYNAFEQPGAILFTDRHEAINIIDTNLARSDPAREIAPGRTTEILENLFEITVPAPEMDNGLTFDHITTFQKGIPDLLEFSNRVASKSWSREKLAELRDEAGGQAGEMHAVTSDNRKANALKLTAYMLPGRSLKASFLHAVGLEAERPSLDQYCGPLFELSVGGNG